MPNTPTAIAMAWTLCDRFALSEMIELYRYRANYPRTRPYCPREMAVVDLYLRKGNVSLGEMTVEQQIYGVALGWLAPISAMRIDTCRSGHPADARGVSALSIAVLAGAVDCEADIVESLGAAWRVMSAFSRASAGTAEISSRGALFRARGNAATMQRAWRSMKATCYGD